MPLKPTTTMIGIPQIYMVEMRADPRRNKHSFRIIAVFTLSREIEDIVNRMAYPRSRASNRSYLFVIVEKPIHVEPGPPGHLDNLLCPVDVHPF